MKKAYFFITLFILNSAIAEIPRGVLSIDKFVQEIKLPIDNKIKQMQQNFIVDNLRNITIYRSDTNQKCELGQTIIANDPILKTTNITSSTSEKTKNIVTYYGCSGQISFKEVTISSINGFYSYELFGPNQISVFKGIKSIGKERTTSLLQLNNQTVFKITEVKRKKYDEIIYQKSPFSLDLNLNGGRIQFDSTQTFRTPYKIRVYSPSRIEYYGETGRLISLANFQKNIGFRGINYFIRNLLNDLPKTKFISSGSQNTKLIEELRNAQTFLISGTNIDYVKNLINEYIKAAEDGNIVDNRR